MNLKRLNPFAGLPNAREVWAWGMYDLANQSFTLLINTLLFALYFKNVVVGDPAKGDALWSGIYAASMLLVVVCSPIVGAIADSRGWRRRFLFGTGLVCSVLTAMLGLAGANQFWLAALLYIPANLSYQLGENFLASFLPGVSTPRTIGRISATGWAMGYVGALVLLIISLVLMKTMGWTSPEYWRPLFVFAGVWFALNMIPSMLFLTEPTVERAHRDVEHRPSLIVDAIGRLKNTVVSAVQYRQLGRFFLAFFVFGMGVQVIIAFASIIASDFGIKDEGLVLFVGQITITAGAAAIATGKFQDRIGARATVMVFLGIWIISTGGLLAISLLPTKPQWAFWVVGNGLGLGIGGIGTAARSLVGRFTPAHKTAEFFGLWGMVYKFAGVVGVASFGQVKAWIGMSTSLALLAGFFVVGLVLLLRVNETAGVRAARRTERDAARERAS